MYLLTVLSFYTLFLDNFLKIQDILSVDQECRTKSTKNEVLKSLRTDTFKWRKHGKSYQVTRISEHHNLPLFLLDE